MKKSKTTVSVFLLALLSIIHARSQEIQRDALTTDQRQVTEYFPQDSLGLYSQGNIYMNDTTFYYTDWYIQLQGGANYAFTENIRNGPFAKGLSPSYALVIGKNFTPVWGMRLHVLGGGDQGRTYVDNRFSFHHISGVIEGTFNVTNFIRHVDEKGISRWNLTFMLGPGFTHTYDFDTDKVETPTRLKPTSHNHFMLYGGIELSYQMSERWNLGLEASTTWTRDKYNWIVYDRKFDGLLNLMLGVRYTLNTRTIKQKYDNSK